MTHISVLGAGHMGAALAKGFLHAGHSVTVWNRTASKCAPLAELGARVASSVVDAVADAELVVDNVTDYEASAALFASADVRRALRGKTLLELASGTPKQAQNAARWMKEHDVKYLDGAIMATPDLIGKPGCTILYSGPTALFEAHKATLLAIADSPLYVGAEIGHANVLDNAILIGLWGVTHGVLQGVAICEAEQFPLDAFHDALKSSWPIIEPLILDTITRIGQRRFATDETSASTVAIGHASVRHALAISREHAIDDGLPTALDRVFQRAVDAGHTGSDVAAVYVGLR